MGGFRLLAGRLRPTGDGVQAQLSKIYSGKPATGRADGPIEPYLPIGPYKQIKKVDLGNEILRDHSQPFICLNGY